jgi:hypothetical protein
MNIIGEKISDTIGDENFNMNGKYLPLDDTTINVVLFVDVSTDQGIDLAMCWLANIPTYLFQNNIFGYEIVFDYETHLNMSQNSYNLLAVPTIRIIKDNITLQYYKQFTCEDIPTIIKKGLEHMECYIDMEKRQSRKRVMDDDMDDYVSKKKLVDETYE